jgi:hypothetical protein
MNIKLIEGSYNVKEALELLTEFIHIKIRFQENKISGQCSEEDIKFREKRIKQLQKSLFDARAFVEQNGESISLKSSIEIG